MVFARDGYLNAKISDIAAEAGRSAASFYNYYDTKADLLIALAEEFHAEATSLATLSFRSGLTRPEALREAVAGFWRTYAKRRGELIGIFQAAMVEGRFRDRWLELRGEAVRRIAAEVRGAAGAGLLPRRRPGDDRLGPVGDARALLLHLARPGRREGRAVRRRARARRGGHHLGEGRLLAARNGRVTGRCPRDQRRSDVNFDLPDHLPPLLTRMDAFIEAEIAPLQAQHPQFFDERREFARTDFERGGLPSREWEELLGRMRAVADTAGWLRYGLPASLGGRGRQQPGHGRHPRAPGRQGTRAAQRPAGRVLHRGELPVAARDGAVRHRRAARGLVAGHAGRRALARLRPDRARARHGRDLAGNHRDAGRRRTGSSTAPSGSTPACTAPPTTWSSPAPPGARATRGASPPSSSRSARRASRSRSTGGRSTCRPTTPRSCSTTCASRPTPCSARWTAGSTSRRRSCTRTGSGRRPPASAPRSTASTRPSATPGSASCSAARWPSTRPSSGRSWNCRPRRRWSGCLVAVHGR